MSRQQHATSGSALISTLLAVVVLTIIVTAFLQSMTSERRTSRSYLNQTKAVLAAESGAAEAINRLQSLLTANPYHAVGSIRHNPGTAEQIMPVFLGSPDPMTSPLSAANPTANDYDFLVSTVNGTTPGGWDAANSVDLNIKDSQADSNGWIGSPTVNGVQTHQPHVAQWIEILQDPNTPEQPDPSSANYNPIVARYAYWIEDETAKVDVVVAGNADGDDGSFERSETDSDVTDLDIGAIPMINQAPLSGGEGQAGINEKIVSLRVDHPDMPLDAKRLNQIAPETDESGRFHSTVFSLSNDLAGNGRRRANLNAIVTDTITPEDIAGDLDDIIYVITGRHIFMEYPIAEPANAIFADAPAEEEQDGRLKDFGKRFYTSPNMPNPSNLQSDHEATYLLRIAANIRDYIDTDSVPIVIQDTRDLGFEIVSGFRPATSWTIGTEPIAIGKEAVPYFDEYAIYAKMLSMTKLPGPGSRREVDFNVDHYLEFYNPTNLDYTAPPGSTLKLYSMQQFDTGTAGPGVEIPDMELDLSGETFPAGVATIVTTAPFPSDDPPGLIPTDANVIRRPPTTEADHREFKNKVGNKQVGSGRYGIRLAGRDSAYTDYQSEFVFSTPDGYVDAFACLSIPGDTSDPFEMTLSNDDSAGTWALPPATRDKRLLWSSTPRGNDKPSRSADARSVNENLTITRGSNSAYGPDQSRFFGNIQGDASFPGTSTWGLPNSAPGNPFTSPTSWPDYHPLLTNGPDRGYAFIRNGPMNSVGELGNIYDPFRKRSSESKATISTARGGGRTLKIGQKDDTFIGATRFSNRNPLSTGWNSAAWRLADYFTTGPESEEMGAPTSRGRININGVLRDDGVALRAALRSFEFLPAPEGDPARAGNLLSESEIDRIISEIKTYLTTNGPFLERGEISQLEFFSSTQAAGGNPSSTAFDRSREEIARRIMEIITTRSASFSVYVIGQATEQMSNGEIRVLSSAKERFVFWLQPTLASEPEAKATSYDYDIIYRKSL